MTRTSIARCFCFAIAVMLLAGLSAAQQEASPSSDDFYTYQHVMVPMRDGVKLETVILTPRNQRGPLPILLQRSPYGVDSPAAAHRPVAAYAELAEDGYIMVFQNIRGRFQSEGEFIMVRPPRSLHDPKAVDEVTDAWDTVDWLVKNVPNNNGRVGIWGTSYPGWLVMQAALNPHPALKAALEAATIDDWFVNDDMHHNGAFRLTYGVDYASGLEANKGGRYTFRYDRGDTYDWFLDLGPLSNIDKNYFHGEIPTWEHFIEHPDRDEFWKEYAVSNFLTEPKLPIMHVAGWWDQEDIGGPQSCYANLENHDTRHWNYFVAGPWSHSQWNRDAASLGPVQFGSDTAEAFRRNIQAKWFAYWLHGKGHGEFPEAQVYQTGTNLWESYPAWPPVKDIEQRRIYLLPGGGLSFEAPKPGASLYAEYVSDPANPVPYRPRPVTATYPGAEWREWQVQDQHFVDHRPDVVTFETEPLKDDLAITGDVVAELFASTSGTDSDWVVKLIDVCPADATNNAAYHQPMAEFELMVNFEILRARYRDDMSHPAAVPVNQPVKYTIDLHGDDHVFRKNHRIMVQVQSSWFPLYDRNPQKFVPNIYQAKAEDYQKATQRVYHSATQPSAIVLPVNTANKVPTDAPDSCYPPVVSVEKQDPAKLESFVGRYESSAGFTLTVTRDGDHLFVKDGGEKLQLYPLGRDEFFVKEFDAQFVFRHEAGGRVTALILRQGARDELAVRVEH